MYKSRIAIFSGAEKPIVITSNEIPPIQKGELLVKNEYTTLCRSDLNTFIGKRIEKTPTILGHEIVGRIAALGPESPARDLSGAPLRENDRVTWAIFASDPESRLAKDGIPQKGPNLFKYGHEQITPTSTLHGGLGEYTLLRANTPVLKVDEQVPLPVAATLNCAVSTVAGALRLAGAVSGKNVLIAGAGMLGVTACAMCKVNGAARLVALDIHPERLEVARQFGADATIDIKEASSDWPERFGSRTPFHLVLEFSGEATMMESTLEKLNIGGTAIWVGGTHPQRPLQINGEQVIRNLWTIKGLHNYNQADFLAAVRFMEHHHRQFPFESLICDRFTLDEVNEAFEYGISAAPFRVGIRLV